MKVLKESFMYRAKTMHNGEAYCSVTSASKAIDTSTQKVRKLIEQGELDYAQPRANGRIMVSVKSITEYLRRNEG